MVFKKIAGDRLKVLLTGEDMQRLAITYDQLDYADDQTRKVILELLELARTETGFDLGDARLFVEAYPYQEEGCVIYFTTLSPGDGGLRIKKPIYNSIVFEFDQVDPLIDGAVRLFSQYSHRIYKSSLYYWRKRFYLILSPFDRTDSRTTSFLSEYGRKYGEGEICAAFIREHGSAIAQEGAIDRLAYFLGERKEPGTEG